MGKALAKHLSDRHEVIVVDRKEAPDELLNNPNITVHEMDILHLPENVLSGVDTVYHVAAKARVPPSYVFPDVYYRDNVNATMELVKKAEKMGVRRIVYTGSSTAYGSTNFGVNDECDDADPLNWYASTKLMGEDIITGYPHNMEYVIARLFTVYGGDQRCVDDGDSLVIGRFIDRYRKGEPLVVHGTGETKRDFVHIDDVVEGLSRMKDCPDKNFICNLGSGKSISIMELAYLFRGLLSDVKIRHEGTPLGYAKKTKASISVAERKLGWKPKNMPIEGIKEFVKKKLIDK